MVYRHSDAVSWPKNAELNSYGGHYLPTDSAKNYGEDALTFSESEINVLPAKSNIFNSTEFFSYRSFLAICCCFLPHKIRSKCTREVEEAIYT